MKIFLKKYWKIIVGVILLYIVWVIFDLSVHIYLKESLYDEKPIPKIIELYLKLTGYL
jgi:hypothetical protein